MAHTFCSLIFLCFHSKTTHLLVFCSFMVSHRLYVREFIIAFLPISKTFPFLTTKKENNNKQTNNPVSPRCMELDSCFPFRQPRRQTRKNVKCDSKQSCQSQVYGELFALSDRSIMGVIYTYHHTCNYICALELL